MLERSDAVAGQWPLSAPLVAIPASLARVRIGVPGNVGSRACSSPHQLEALRISRDQRVPGHVIEGIAVQVLDVGRDLVDLVCAAVKVRTL